MKNVVAFAATAALAAGIVSTPAVANQPVRYDIAIVDSGNRVSATVIGRVRGRNVRNVVFTAYITRAARPGVRGRFVTYRTGRILLPRRVRTVRLSYRCAPSSGPLIYYVTVGSRVQYRGGRVTDQTFRSNKRLVKYCA